MSIIYDDSGMYPLFYMFGVYFKDHVSFTFCTYIALFPQSGLNPDQGIL